MEINEKEKKIQNDLLNNLIQTEFIDLKGVDSSKYTCDDIIQESLNSKNQLEIVINKENLIENAINDKDKGQIKNETKKNENNIINKKSPSSDIEILSSKDIPKNHLVNPIDFVDYIENEQTNDVIKKIKNEFIIQKYEKDKHLKFEILKEINTNNELNRTIFPENELLNIIYCYEDILITGNILGQTKTFSLSDKKLLKTFFCPIKSDLNYQVTAIDIANDKKFIFIGYSNGNIAMFEQKSQKLKLLINDIIKDCECLCIKFLHSDKKGYVIIVCDQLGNVFMITIKSGYYKFKYEAKKINGNKNFHAYFIRLIKFNEKILKRHSFLKNLKEYIIIGNLENFRIYELQDYSKVEFQFEIKQPRWMNDFTFGDITFGIGKNPQSRESLGDDDDEPQILMCASFDNLICLYIIPIDNGALTFPILIGHYFNFNENGNNRIVRIGFLAKGAVFLIDKNNFLKILNTRKFIKGEPKIDEDTLIPLNNENYSLIEIQEVYKFKSEIREQINLKTPDNTYKQSYMNSIIENFETNNIVVLSNKSISILELINFEDCLRKLQQEEKWMDMLILGIEIYKGKISCLEGIPPKVEDRKKKLREFLKQLISVYIIADDMNQKNKYGKNGINRRNSYYENQENLKHTEDKIELIIEFCSEIEGFNFLLDKILNMYETKGYGDLFLSKLESFILCDKMLKCEISEDLLLKLIELYEKKNKTNILNKLLLHIDIKSLCNPVINAKINDLSLLPSMINILVNGNNPDYFKPVKIMYELYQKSNPLNFNSYAKIVENKNLTDILNSKEYKGHKLLWYIKKCFIRRKYPLFIDNMEEKQYSKFIIDLIFWLMKESIVKDLMSFDSDNYFEILNKIFEGRNLEIINKFNSSKENVKNKMRIINEQNYNYAYKDFSPVNLINYLIIQVKKIKGSQKIKLDFNLFIAKAFKNTQLAKDIIMDSIIYILSIYSYVNKMPIENKLKKLILILINILNHKIFDENDLRKILMNFNDHIFDEIKAFIYNKLNEYKNCLEVYLNKDCKIFNKEDKLFNYVDNTLHALKENKENFFKFKKLVLENMINIGNVSEMKMLEIIYKWFYNDKDDKKNLINILTKDPKKQFLYIEPLAKEFIIEYKENEDKKNKNQIIKTNEEKEFIITTLGIYIQLLCKLGKKEKVLRKLKDCPLYPIDTCIEICEEYDVKDALIFLYKKTGGFQNAIKVTLRIIDECYAAILKIITADIFIKKDFEEQISNFNNSINQSIEILENNHSQKISDIIKESDDVDLWFQILNKLYYISIKYDSHLKTMSEKRKEIGIFFEEAIFDNIKDVLEKMSSYIGVRRILEEVSKNNKEAGYKEFKPILLKIFETYDNQSFILNSVGRLLINLCFENLESFKEENFEGRILELNKCDICNENFHRNSDNEARKILVFKCTHIMHRYCAYSEIFKNITKYICPICRKDEVDNAVSSFSLSLLGNKILIPNKRIEIETKVKLNKDGIDVERYKRGFNRMKNFDINFNIKNVSFIDESVKSCRGKYKGNH